MKKRKREKEDEKEEGSKRSKKSEGNKRIQNKLKSILAIRKDVIFGVTEEEFLFIDPYSKSVINSQKQSFYMKLYLDYVYVFYGRSFNVNPVGFVLPNVFLCLVDGTDDSFLFSCWNMVYRFRFDYLNMSVELSDEYRIHGKCYFQSLLIGSCKFFAFISEKTKEVFVVNAKDFTLFHVFSKHLDLSFQHDKKFITMFDEIDDEMFLLEKRREDFFVSSREDDEVHKVILTVSFLFLSKINGFCDIFSLKSKEFIATLPFGFVCAIIECSNIPNCLFVKDFKVSSFSLWVDFKYVASKISVSPDMIHDCDNYTCFFVPPDILFTCGNVETSSSHFGFDVYKISSEMIIEKKETESFLQSSVKGRVMNFTVKKKFCFAEEEENEFRIESTNVELNSILNFGLSFNFDRTSLFFFFNEDSLLGEFFDVTSYNDRDEFSHLLSFDETMANRRMRRERFFRERNAFERNNGFEYSIVEIPLSSILNSTLIKSTVPAIQTNESCEFSLFPFSNPCWKDCAETNLETPGFVRQILRSEKRKNKVLKRKIVTEKFSVKHPILSIPNNLIGIGLSGAFSIQTEGIQSITRSTPLVDPDNIDDVTPDQARKCLYWLHSIIRSCDFDFKVRKMAFDRLLEVTGQFSPDVVKSYLKLLDDLECEHELIEIICEDQVIHESFGIDESHLIVQKVVSVFDSPFCFQEKEFGLVFLLILIEKKLSQGKEESVFFALYLCCKLGLFMEKFKYKYLERIGESFNQCFAKGVLYLEKSSKRKKEFVTFLEKFFEFLCYSKKESLSLHNIIETLKLDDETRSELRLITATKNDH